jgi:diamine N-acetyltransferase
VTAGVSIRRGLVADATALAEFAAHAFADAFGAVTHPVDLAAHLEASYRPDLQAAELADPTIVTLLMEEGARIVGYAQVRHNATPPDCVTVANPVELHRFYVARSQQGTGLASRLMQEALQAAAVDCGGDHAWLGVWEKNDRAMAFYRKVGFVDIGSTHYLVGTDRQTDRVFLKRLS